MLKTYLGRHRIGVHGRHSSRKEWLQAMAINVTMVIDGLVGLLGLGYIRCDLRCWLLFDVFTED